MNERVAAASSADARVRIVDAGVRCIAREGVTGASMAAIALEAGVSKALLHYHYHDRSRLLAEIVERIGTQTVERERTAIDESDRMGGRDAFWHWLEGELRRGELAALQLRRRRRARRCDAPRVPRRAVGARAPLARSNACSPSSISRRECPRH